MSSLLCPHCGQSHPVGAAFCPTTGKALAAAPPPKRNVLYLGLGAAGLLFLIMGGVLLSRGSPDRASSDEAFVATAIQATLDKALPANTLPVDLSAASATPVPSRTPVPTETAALLPLPATAVATATPVPQGGLSGHVVFTCYDGSDDELCLINADGSGRVQLTDNATGDFYGSLSPDGQLIFFSRQIKGGNYEIFRMTPDGANVIQLTSNGAGNFAPEMSPDGSQIVFVSTQGNTGQQIWIMNSDGTDARRLTTQGENIDPSWSPTGRSLSFASDQSGSRQIWVMDTAGGNARQITNVSDAGGRNDWSQDGRTLVFYAGQRAGGNRRVYFIDVDGRNPYVLPFDSDSLGPSFSPDGQWVTFTSVKDGKNEIYVARVDGSTALKLSSVGVSDYQPRWGP